MSEEVVAGLLCEQPSVALAVEPYSVQQPASAKTQLGWDVVQEEDRFAIARAGTLARVAAVALSLLALPTCVEDNTTLGEPPYQTAESELIFDEISWAPLMDWVPSRWWSESYELGVTRAALYGRAAAALKIPLPDNSIAGCTGALISENLLLTAAHCVSGCEGESCAMHRNPDGPEIDVSFHPELSASFGQFDSRVPGRLDEAFLRRRLVQLGFPSEFALSNAVPLGTLSEFGCIYEEGPEVASRRGTPQGFRDTIVYRCKDVEVLVPGEREPRVLSPGDIWGRFAVEPDLELGSKLGLIGFNPIEQGADPELRLSIVGHVRTFTHECLIDDGIRYAGCFRHGVDMQPGDSGGPVFLRSNGALVGVTSAETRRSDDPWRIYEVSGDTYNGAAQIGERVERLSLADDTDHFLPLPIKRASTGEPADAPAAGRSTGAGGRVDSEQAESIVCPQEMYVAGYMLSERAARSNLTAGISDIAIVCRYRPSDASAGLTTDHDFVVSARSTDHVRLMPSLSRYSDFRNRALSEFQNGGPASQEILCPAYTSMSRMGFRIQGGRVHTLAQAGCLGTPWDWPRDTAQYFELDSPSLLPSNSDVDLPSLVEFIGCHDSQLTVGLIFDRTDAGLLESVNSLCVGIDWSE
ncbi:MAG: hypothetical protein ACI81R_003014 [Bradymonadia bacterium]